MRKDTSKLIDLDALFAKSESNQLKETLKESAVAGNVPPEVAARIDLVNKFNFTTQEVDKMTSDEALEEYNKRSSLKESIDIDSILMEWSYRCDKGYPDFNNKHDMIKLQEILDEMGVQSPFKRITEKDKPAAAKKTVDKALAGKTKLLALSEKYKNLKILIKYLEELGKVEQFEKYMDDLPEANVVSFVASQLAELCANDSKAKTLAKIFKSEKSLTSITKINYKTGIYYDLFSIIPGGIGPGEIMVSWTVIGATTQGSSLSFDIDYNNKHYEVKALENADAKGAWKYSSIRPAKYGMTGNFAFTNKWFKFWSDIIIPYYDNKLRDGVIAITDNAAVQDKITKALDALERIPRTTPGGQTLPSVEMVHKIFNDFYENVKEIHKFLPKSVKDSADVNRLAVKSVSTDAQYWIDKDDVDDITKAAGKDKEISIKVGTKITNETKEARIWFSNLLNNEFVKKPENFVIELRAIRDGFAKNKAGLIYFYDSKCYISTGMDDFYTSNITSGQYRFDLKSRVPGSKYAYAQEQ